MRIFGWTLIAIGIGFAAFVVIRPREGKSTVRAVTGGIGIAAIGLRLLANGPRVTPRVLPAGAGVDAGQTGPGAFAEGTVDIPLTPEVSALIAREATRQKRLLVIAVAGILGGGQLLGLILYFFRRQMFPDIPPDDPWCIWIYVAGAGLGAVVAFLIGIVGVVTGALARRDRRELTYLRTTGPMRLDSYRNGFTLRLVDRSFGVDTKRVAPVLRGLDWASVDYSRHAHIILRVRNRAGVSVYCVDGDRGSLAVRQ